MAKRATVQTTRAGQTALKGTRQRSIISLAVTVLVVVALLPGIINRIDRVYPTSTIAHWFGAFKQDYPWLGLDILETFQPRELFDPAYWIGVAGTSLLVILLIYPMRKRIKFLRRMGGNAGWLHIHVLLGALTPVLILYHANFNFGSLNANIALGIMLTVAVSGVIGRYLFTPLHKNFYERRAVAHTVRDDISTALRALPQERHSIEPLIDYLNDFDNWALKPTRSLLAGFTRTGDLAARTRAAERHMVSQCREYLDWQAETNRWPRKLHNQWRTGLDELNKDYFTAVRRASKAAKWERAFAFWEFLHLPLSFVMLLAVLAHIVIVHTY